MTASKAPYALKTIREVAEILDLPQHVLRFWETKFPSLRPLKRQGGRRFYRQEDIEQLRRIKTLLHEQGYTIKGALSALGEETPAPPRAAPAPAAAMEIAPPPAGENPSAAYLRSLRRDLQEIRALLQEAY